MTARRPACNETATQAPQDSAQGYARTAHPRETGQPGWRTEKIEWELGRHLKDKGKKGMGRWLGRLAERPTRKGAEKALLGQGLEDSVQAWFPPLF